eukprot:351491-Chlamydomonas_euryale.AAC.9
MALLARPAGERRMVNTFVHAYPVPRRQSTSGMKHDEGEPHAQHLFQHASGLTCATKDRNAARQCTWRNHGDLKPWSARVGPNPPLQ